MKSSRSDRQLRFVVDRNTPFAEEAFSTLGEVEAIDTSMFSRDRISNADAIIVRSEVKIGAPLLEGTRVQVVGTTTIGVDHLDEAWLKSRGIAYANAPGSNANSVSEYILAGLLVLAKNKKMRLRGRKLGVVGVGNVGSRVEKMGATLGMEVLLNDPPLARATGNPKYLPLEEVLRADIVTIHVPLTREGPDATVHLFNEQRISRMKEDAVLINTSRGPVVDNAALSTALRNGGLGGAILDVWEHEPAFDVNLLEHALIGTPHIAGYSLDGKTNAVQIVYNTVCRFLDMKPVWVLPADKLPLPEASTIDLPQGWRPGEENLDSIVSRCYSILADDRSLRAIMALPVDERRVAFQKLRTSYRVRREFRATTLKAVRTDDAGLLRSLGFTVDP